MAWTRDLGQIIGKLFFCNYYYSIYKINATKGIHYFFGKESNAVTASLMTEYAIKSILKEARKLYVHNLCPQSRSFAIGAVAQLHKRINVMMLSKLEQGEGTGIVLHDLYKSEQESNNLAFEQLGVELLKKKNRSKNEVDLEAFYSGKDFGNKINLSGQLVNKEQLRIK